jgi:hypothetical protein
LTSKDRYELRIAALLHDCGKITTPVHVVDKSTKLETIFDRIELVATRFANTTQIHRVAGPMMARKQISFEAEPVSNGQWAPQTGDVLIVQKDVGGGEFFQLYALRDGKLDLLTDGKSRNAFNA